jgi:hypothetical protein
MLARGEWCDDSRRGGFWVQFEGEIVEGSSVPCEIEFQGQRQQQRQVDSKKRLVLLEQQLLGLKGIIASADRQ